MAKITSVVWDISVGRAERMRMNKEQIRSLIEETGVIPSIRVSSTADALFAAEAVCSSGIPIVEVTTTVPGAVKVISDVVKANPKLIVGAGIIMDIETAH